MPGRVEENSRPSSDARNSRNSSEEGHHAPMSVDGVYRNKKMSHVASLLVGSDVRIKTKDGKCFEGTLEAVSPKFEVAVRLVYLFVASEAGKCISRDKVYDKMTFEPDSITEIESYAELDAKPGSFKIDAFIGERTSVNVKRSNGDMPIKELERWEPEEEHEIGGLDEKNSSRGQEGGWTVEDMFARNSELIEVQSDYREDMAQYSNAPLPDDDNSEEFQLRKQHAERIARQIESNPSSRHAAELESEDKEVSLSGRPVGGAPPSGNWRGSGPGPTGPGNPQGQGYPRFNHNGPARRNDRRGGMGGGGGRGGNRGGGSMTYSASNRPNMQNFRGPEGPRFSPHERSPAAGHSVAYSARSPPFAPNPQQQQQPGTLGREPPQTNDEWHYVKGRKEKKPPNYNSDSLPRTARGPREGPRVEDLREFSKNFQLGSSDQQPPHVQMRPPPQHGPPPHHEQQRPLPHNQQHPIPSNHPLRGGSGIIETKPETHMSEKEQAENRNRRVSESQQPQEEAGNQPPPLQSAVQNEKTPEHDSKHDEDESARKGFSLNPDAAVFTPRSQPMTPSTPLTPGVLQQMGPVSYLPPQAIYQPSPSPQVQVMGGQAGMYQFTSPTGIMGGPPGTSFNIPPPTATILPNARPQQHGPGMQGGMQQFVMANPHQIFTSQQGSVPQHGSGMIFPGSFPANTRFLGPSPGQHYMIPQVLQTDPASPAAIAAQVQGSYPSPAVASNHPPPASSANSVASHSNNASQPPTPGPQGLGNNNPSPSAPQLSFSTTPQSPHYQAQGYIQAPGHPVVQTVMMMQGPGGPFYIPQSAGGYFSTAGGHPIQVSEPAQCYTSYAPGMVTPTIYSQGQVYRPLAPGQQTHNVHPQS